GDRSFQPNTRATPRSSSNPPTGRLGIVHSNLHRGRRLDPLQIPQPEGWVSFIPTYTAGDASILFKSSNREVGYRSFQPTPRATPRSSSNPPTGRLGIVHSNLHRGRRLDPLQIPQPGGWGSFIPAYTAGDASTLFKSPNREVGDCSFQPTPRATPRLSSNPPTREVGDRSFQPTPRATPRPSSNPPTGRLGIVHSSLHRGRRLDPLQIPQPGGWGFREQRRRSSLVGRNERSPTSRLGDLKRVEASPAV